MPVSLPTCPACGAAYMVKNGKIHHGKQNFKCRDCDRQFVEDPQNKIIDEATNSLIDKLLLEKIPFAGIARVVGVSEPSPELRESKTSRCVSSSERAS